MSSSTKSADLAELKTLRTRLSNWEKAQKDVQNYESAIYSLNNKSDDSVYFRKEPTNRYEEAYRKMAAKNSENSSKVIGKVLVIAAVILVAMIVGWLALGGKLVKDTYLYTPEIVREYSGVYYNVQGHERNCTITITSCKENGKFEGTFEFSGNEAYTNKPFYGKYSVSGKITKKSAEGYVNATLEFKEWIERPSGWDPLEPLKLKIYDNYEAIRCFEYDMCLYASDRKEPATVTNLKTPEIIGTYSGKFTPPIGKTGDAILTIESCDENGVVTGLFEYTFELAGGGKSTDKCTWNGQITKKYDNGSLVLKLEPDEDLASGYMFYNPTIMEIEFYDNYRSVDSLEGIHWFYEDEGFKKDPNPAKTPLQAAVNKAAPIVFPAYIVLVIVVLVILSKKNTSFTAEQQRRLNELLKQDNENKIKNENARKRAVAEAQKDNRKMLADYKQLLEGAKQREREAENLCRQMRILSDKDKTLQNVNFLIEKMESGRADSLKEALILLDADIQHRHDSWLRAELAHQESMRRMQAEAEARRDQMYHNLNVEYQQRRQADELEKIRKALED